MRRAIDFFRTRRLGDVILLVVILVMAAGGWLSSGLPKGSDAIAGLPPSAAARDLLLRYHELGGWSTHWYLGYPLYYMFPSLAHTFLWMLSVPFGWVAASKLLFLGFFVLSGLFAYLFVFELTKSRAAGVVAALVYSMAPYHLVEVVFEGHQGCFGMALMLVPLIFWLTEKTLTNPSVMRVVGGGILFGALILTHPQTFPILVGPFWSLYVVFRLGMLHAARSDIRTPAVACGMILCLGLLVTAFWWLPLRSEASNLFGNEYSLETSKSYDVSFPEAITVSPTTGNSAAWGFSNLPLGLIKVLRVLLVALVSVGVLLNFRNKHIWFFAALAVASILLAMGLGSPVNIFGFAYDHVPFFNNIRTPGRFLLLTCLSYSVLAGFGTKSLVALVRSRDMKVAVAAALCLGVVANSWGEARDGFETFQFTQDQEGAISWISEQDSGRVMIVPLNVWTTSAETHDIINPMVYTNLHEHDTVLGGAPNVSPKWTGSFMDSVFWGARVGQRMDLGVTMDVLGVSYIVVDKTDPSYENYVLDESCVSIWDSATVEIYENSDPYPRVFATASPYPALAGTIATDWEEGTQQFSELDRSGIQTVDFRLIHPGECRVNLENEGPCWLVLSESYYPGWKARIDGESLSSQRVLGFLNAWYIEDSGDHQITLEFTPSTSKRVGTIISAITVAGILALAVGMLLRCKYRRKPQILE